MMVAWNRMLMVEVKEVASFGCILKVGPTRFADRFGYGR